MSMTEIKKKARKIKKTEKEIDKVIKKAKGNADREDYTKAIAFYQEAARLAKSIGDRRAVDFSMDAARYAMKTGNNFKTGWSYKCAADNSLAFNDFNNAINFAMKAIEHFEKANSMYAVQWCYNIIGRASEEIKDYELAVKNYKKSLELNPDNINATEQLQKLKTEK